MTELWERAGANAPAPPPPIVEAIGVSQPGATVALNDASAPAGDPTLLSAGTVQASRRWSAS
jgi:hypothetical protein